MDDERADEERQAEEARRKAVEGEHLAPEFGVGWFHCVHCGVLTTQKWAQLRGPSPFGAQAPTPVFRCTCENCDEESYWYGWEDIVGEEAGEMLRPAGTLGPRPHPEMPDEVKHDYNEAREIVAKSPRGAGALARLAVQKLVNELEPDQDGAGAGANLNDKIGRMVKEGLPITIQQALDALRVVGNNSVHALELDLRDDVPTVVAMFDCMNAIVENRVAQPGRIRQLYEQLPEGARAAIERRDKVE